MDDEDLYYYRSRYYDPTVGRFLSEDTIGFSSGDFNFYRYVENSPVNNVDPGGYGFVTIVVVAGIKITVAAAIAVGAIDVFRGWFERSAFNLKQLKKLIREEVRASGWKNTIFNKDYPSHTCVESSEGRASDILAAVDSMKKSGTFGSFSARIWIVSGWDPGIGSMHTYNVVEIYDSAGTVVHAFDVDNYLGVTYISTHTSIDTSSHSNTLFKPPVK